MYNLDALYTNSDARITFADYPPAITLFQYFFCKVLGSFEEYYLICSLNIFYFGIAIYLFKNVKWKNILRIIINLLVVFLIPTVFYINFFYNIYVDAILGILFAYTLIAYFSGDATNRDMIQIGISLFVLSLIKSSGLGLSIIAILIISADLFYKQKKSRLSIKEIIINSFQKKNLFKMLPVFAVLLACVSWELHIKLAGVQKEWDTTTSIIKEFLVMLIGDGPGYQKTVFSLFTKSLLTENLISGSSISISYISISIFILVVPSIFLVIILKIKDYKRYIFAQILLFASSFIYAACLLALYLFSFSQYEALHLASFVRYASTFQLGSLLYSIAVIIIKAPLNGKKLSTPYIISSVIFLAVVVILFSTKILTIAIPDSEDTVSCRKKYEHIKIVNELTDENDKIYYIAEHYSGLAYHISRFNALPANLSYYPYSYSLGEPEDTSDVWTQNISCEEWARTLYENYNYVYVFRTNDVFDQIYGELFDDGYAANDSLYYINKDNNEILLIEVTVE